MPLKDVITVIVDDRERGEVLDTLETFERINISSKRLAVGDYEIDGHLLVERKTLPDLIESIKDGRLFSQATRLAESPLQSLIILEGTTKDLGKSRMRREAIQGALITVSVYLGIPLLRSLHPQETAQLMVYAARQGRAIASGALQRKGKRPRGKRRTQLHILQGLPGVGAERAKALLDVFGSIEAVLTASSDELQAINGIGLNTAERIRWAVRESNGIYVHDY